MAWPLELQVNAFAGEDVSNAATLDDSVHGWAARPQDSRLPTSLRPGAPPDEADWTNPRIGWGLVVPDNPGLRHKKLVTGSDAPEPIRRLLAARPDAPVLRYRPQSETAYTHLRRYYPDGTAQDIALVGSERGVGRGALPLYLLIYATPDVIPWRFQYLLNQAAFVGRLTLTGRALEGYVDHLLDGWGDAESDPNAALVWAVDHGADDISHLMRKVIAEPVFREYSDDDDLRAGSLLLAGGDEPSAKALVAALADRRPAVIVTTSHGMTGPLSNLKALRAGLGLPVDVGFRPVEIDSLLREWKPDGAIWYAHACCSAGSDGHSAYRSLFAPDSDVGRILSGVAALGARLAPLPEALLSAAKPARAFIGHVEPTFDWTISNPQTGQPLTSTIRGALHERLYQPWPVGYALRQCYQHVGVLFGERDQAYEAFNRGEDTLSVALAAQLAALDRRSMVIIGDPTVCLPAP